MTTNSKEYNRAYHARRSPEAKAKKLEQQRLRKRAIMHLVRDFKAKHGCIDCGEKDSVVLELDHADPAIKTAAVSELVHHGHSLEAVMAEVAKCDVRCCNCHRRKTAKDFWN